LRVKDPLSRGSLDREAFMNQRDYKEIEGYMLSCMKDSAHDCQHIYRVLYHALEISESYELDKDIIIAAALLHDIGREAQFKDASIDHASEGARMAYDYLIALGWSVDQASHVRACVLTHRFRSDNPPKTIEAKVIFDADKLDVTGAIGIARTIAYKGRVAQPMYSVGGDGQVLSGDGPEVPSFFREYHFKLKKLYDRFYTEEAHRMAITREKASQAFYQAIYDEMSETHRRGLSILDHVLERELSS